jgi:hypothetical protein
MNDDEIKALELADKIERELFGEITQQAAISLDREITGHNGDEHLSEERFSWQHVNTENDSLRIDVTEDGMIAMLGGACSWPSRYTPNEAEEIGQKLIDAAQKAREVQEPSDQD